MFLSIDSPEANNIIVFLNGKPVKSYISANDIEGWIEIIDISSMSPLTILQTKKININGKDKDVPCLYANQVEPGNESEIKECDLKTIKKYGKVEFKIL